MNAATISSHPRPVHRVLVVDDQTALRLALARGLVRSGYEVVLAGSGRDALARLAGDPGVSAVLVGSAMPDVGGVEVVPEVLRRRCPGVPVLCITDGDTPFAITGHPLVGVIRMPVRVTDVCDLLDQLLAQTAAVPAQRRRKFDVDGEPDRAGAGNG